jgi:hypothetical protein
MASEEFVGYVGHHDFHDGHILSLDHQGDVAHVRVRGASGQDYDVLFRRVQVVRAEQPEGMILYALSEMKARPPMRRFVFSNWDEEGKSFLEVEAESFSVTP